MSKLINLTGQKFNRLNVIERSENDMRGKSRWLCLCDCGNKIIVQGEHLRCDKTKSCGCLRKEIMTKHGYSNDRTYNSWEGMIQRCTNPNNKGYMNYGGRGIVMYKRWRTSFPNFLENMGESPGVGYSIERINNNKGYYKLNCKWATSKEQNRNSRHNSLISFNGKIQCLIEWSEETGISKHAIRWRLKHGWSVERALTTPVMERKIAN